MDLLDGEFFYFSNSGNFARNVQIWFKSNWRCRNFFIRILGKWELQMWVKANRWLGYSHVIRRVTYWGWFFQKINFFYFQFSVSQFTWQIWHTNNSIKSNKLNRIMRKCRCCAWVWKKISRHWGSNSQPMTWHGAVHRWSVWDPSAILAPHILRKIIFFSFGK